MALDRQSIEKRDFPIGRRGYDPDAVDSHLAVVADEFEAVRRAQRPRGESLASTASEQVRLIVEAAEQSAADIEREADLEARQIRQEARDASELARSDAGTQAREHVERVSEAASAMLERIDQMESELRGLLDTVRSGAGRVASDLSVLQSSVSELRSPTGATFEPEVPAAEPGAAAEPAAAEPLPASDEELDEVDVVLVEETVVDAETPGETDEEGARLIALNMALNGTPRDEVEAYLTENFGMEDPGPLLDDVYARVG